MIERDDTASRLSKLELGDILSLESARDILLMCGSYQRLPAMIHLSAFMESDEWLTLLGEEWSSCDNVGLLSWELGDTPFADVIADPIKHRRRLMSEEEFALLESLPSEVVIYRGCYRLNKWGLSWTLDRDLASRFPFTWRYEQEGQALLVKARVPRDEIIAVKLDRSETEVIAYRPKHISTSYLHANTKRPAATES